MVEITVALSDGHRDGRVSLGVEEIGFAGFRRAYKICRQRKEVLEREGERVFESGKDGLREMVGRVREFVEEKALHRAAEQPWYVQESERERSGRN